MSQKPNEETVKFSAEQMEMLKEADAAFERGEGHTLAEAREMADKRTEAWLTHSQPA